MNDEFQQANRPMLLGYVALTAIAGGVTLGLHSRAAPSLEWGTLGTLLALSFLAGLRPLRVPRLRVNFVATHAFVLAALALAGPLGAMLVDLAGLLGALFGRGKRMKGLHLVFNAGLIPVATLASWGALSLFERGDGGHLPYGVLPLVVATAAYFVASSLLVASAVALERGQLLFRAWRESCLWTLPSFGASPLIAVGILAMAPALFPWGALAALLAVWPLIELQRKQHADAP